MLIVIEGVDGSGKSTLFNELKSSLYDTWAISRNGRVRIEDDLVGLLEWLWAAPSFQPILMDRHPLISEKVYGPILRNRDLTLNLTEDLKSRSYRRIHTIIYCCPPFKTIEENIMKLRQMKGINENLKQLVFAYETEMVRFRYDNNMNVILYDYTKMDLNELLEQLE